MTTNQTIAMVFPLFTVGAVALTGYGIRRWVQGQRTKYKDGSVIIGRRTYRAISEDLSKADAIIRQAQRDLQHLSNIDGH